MRENLKKHGAFSWFELMADDVEGAKSFYTQLFGWELENYPMDMGEYWVIKVDNEEVGGIMKKPPEAAGAPPYWATYVTVDDVDKVAEDAKRLGANLLVPPMDIPKVGRFCVIMDPQGAVISAIKYVPEED